MTRKVAQSVQEAAALYSIDNIKEIVKASLQRYIESFMNLDGQNRPFLESISKLGLTYVTDQSFDQDSDRTLRKTQLARMFEQIRQQLPCILIVDSKFEYVPANFTGIEAVYINQGYWYGTLQIVRNLTISVVGATRDQASANFLHGLLSVLFGELRFLAHGTRMTGNWEKGETWAVTMGLPELGNVTRQAVTDDPKDSIWSFSIEVKDMLFEDRVTLKMPMEKWGPTADGALNTPDLGKTPPIIHAPDTIALNDPTRIFFEMLQPGVHKVIISNPNIATINPNSYILSPRMLGTCDIQVIRPVDTLNQGAVNSQTGATQQVVASKTIRIVAPS
jgi:hypothetical protein